MMLKNFNKLLSNGEDQMSMVKVSYTDSKNFIKRNYKALGFFFFYIFFYDICQHYHRKLAFQI